MDWQLFSVHKRVRLDVGVIYHNINKKVKQGRSVVSHIDIEL